MPTPIYATVDAFAEWIDTDLPANARALLRTASMAVREATEAAWYDTDPATWMPTDASVAQAFSDATCCQAAFLNATGYDPFAGFESSVEVAVGVGSAKVQYADAADAAAARQAAIYGLCPEAWRILRQARIYYNSPWVVG